MKRPLAALTLAIALGAAACSSDGGSDTDTATPTTEATAAEATTEAETTPAEPTTEAETSDAPEAAAGGETITGTGYSYSVPEGWGYSADLESAAAGTDTFAVDLTPSGTFADNVNVVITEGEGAIEVFESAEYLAQLESLGAVDGQVHDRVSLDGVEAAHTSATMGAEENPYLVDQIAASRDGSTYVLTLSFRTESTPEERAAAMDVVVSSWVWS